MRIVASNYTQKMPQETRGDSAIRIATLNIELPFWKSARITKMLGGRINLGTAGARHFVAEADRGDLFVGVTCEDVTINGTIIDANVRCAEITVEWLKLSK